MFNKQEIANGADLIVNGYAFTHQEALFRVLNLNRQGHACVLSGSGEVLESSMDEIEEAIVCDYFSRNRQYLSEV